MFQIVHVQNTSSLGLLSLNHDFERRSKSFTLEKHQTSLAFFSLNHDFFAVGDVDAGRQHVYVVGVLRHLDAVEIIDGLA